RAHEGTPRTQGPSQRADKGRLAPQDLQLGPQKSHLPALRRTRGAQRSASTVTIATTSYKNLIGGRWVDATSGATFDSVSPANHEEVIGTFPASSAADVDAAVEAAKAAYPA